MDKSSIMDFRQVPTYACASFTYIRQVKNKRRVSDSKCYCAFLVSFWKTFSLLKRHTQNPIKHLRWSVLPKLLMPKSC